MAVNLGIDGKATNTRDRGNMFADDLIKSEKQTLREKMDKDKDAVKDKLKMMGPAEVFSLFDEDDSGLISYEEFRKVLPYLSVYISDAKAFRYFRLCDTDGSGEIDIDEFQVALFACDPTAGNPVGFIPSKNLTPLDAFEMFDENQSGFLDEDEFVYALEYLGIKITDEKREKIFLEYDYDRTGSVDYPEFREMYCKLCDIKRELEDRNVDVPTFAKRKNLEKILCSLLMDEEAKEIRALAEARRYKKWIFTIRDKKKVIQQAEFRAYQELRTALDAAGHTYVFGEGTNRQFIQASMETLKTENFNFQCFDRILELWRDRVQPEQLVDRLRALRKAQEMEDKRDMNRPGTTGLGAVGKQNENRRIIIDPYLEAMQSKFTGINCALNTATLWGRRVHHVACSESVIFALADTGEVYTWGGKSHWWHEIQPDSLFQTKWRGDTTPRSQLLLGTVEKEIVLDAEVAINVYKMSPEDRKVDMIKNVAKYYNVWEPPPNPATRMLWLDKDILPRLIYDDVKFSLSCRGKVIEEATKLELCDMLYEDIILEKKLLGERAHKAIKELETQIDGLMKRHKVKMATEMKARIENMWKPLQDVQIEQKAKEKQLAVSTRHNEVMKVEQQYNEWRDRIAKKREDLNPTFSPRGNSLHIDLNGITPRGPDVSTPRGYQCAIQISAGQNHAALLHKTGQLYTWGSGLAGRLGLDLTEDGDPQAHCYKPRLVQSLTGRPVLRVSLGQSHSGAIVAGGEVYMWGSTSNGKCSLGDIVSKEECYCSIPTRVFIGPEDRKIRKLSCGSAHTAYISESGTLYVVGCGDGGRLGLGAGNYATVYDAVLVESLQHERIANVSCGNTTTIVSTEVKHDWVGIEGAKFRKLCGGKVFMAGSRNVLGEQCDVFTQLKSLDHVTIKQVSAGFQHTVLVSAEGELWIWGHNKNGACGFVPKVPTDKFVATPRVTKCFYADPINIAREPGSTAYQSSIYSERDAKYAVNGNVDGNGIKKCACTQQDPQSWLEIDLGQMSVIDEIKVWNRTDVPRESTQSQDMFTSKLFPCWVMIGRDPFIKDISTLRENLQNSVAKAKFTENKRCSVWKCPHNTQGRYVRVQLEGFNSLTIAEFEVFGHYGVSKGVGRVSYATAGRDVTVAVVRAVSDPKDVEVMFARAAYSDAQNADILRQLETYALEYDKFGRGDVLFKDCRICKGDFKCEICILYDKYGWEIDLMEPGIGGRRQHMKYIKEYLMTANKPPLEYKPVILKDRVPKWQMKLYKYRKFLNPWKWVTGGFKDEEINVLPSHDGVMDANPQQEFERLCDIEEIEDAEAENPKTPDTADMAKRKALEDSKVPDKNGKFPGDPGYIAPTDSSNGKPGAGYILKAAEEETKNEGEGGEKKKKKKKKVKIGEEGDAQSAGPSSSIGTAILKANVKFRMSSHMMKANSDMISVGDTLASGHTVRSALPKSIAEVADKSYDVAGKMKSRQDELDEAARRRKEKADLR